MQNDLDPKGLARSAAHEAFWAQKRTTNPTSATKYCIDAALDAYIRHLSATVPAGDGELVERVKVLEKALRETIELAEECEGRLDTHDSTAVGFDARIRAIRTALEAACLVLTKLGLWLLFFIGVVYGMEWLWKGYV